MSPPNRILALWAVPRSVSTAFERMMRARGDFECLHEPFVAYYYYGEDRVNDNYNEGIEPDPSHHWSAIRDGILEAAESSPVFFKDMAYHPRKCLSPEFLAPFDSTFLVRDPRRSLASLYNLQPNSSFEEAGFEQQLRMMRMVHEMTGEPLVVIRSEDLKSDPQAATRRYCESVGIPFIAEALEWEEGAPSQDWKPWERWHAEAMSSTGFETAEHEAVGEDPRLAKVPPEILARCEKIYEEMQEFIASTQRP
jgi:hypothetical protein